MSARTLFLHPEPSVLPPDPNLIEQRLLDFKGAPGGPWSSVLLWQIYYRIEGTDAFILVAQRDCGLSLDALGPQRITNGASANARLLVHP